MRLASTGRADSEPYARPMTGSYLARISGLSAAAEGIQEVYRGEWRLSVYDRPPDLKGPYYAAFKYQVDVIGDRVVELIDLLVVLV